MGGNNSKQHDIERQHVHVDGLELQQQRLKDRDVGLFEEIEDIHFLGVERIVERRRDIGDLGHEDREQKDVRDVDLPGAPQHARARDDEAALAHGAAIDESRGVAGNEDEDLGRVGKAVIADGEPVHDVLGNVVEKNQPQRDAAEQIEPQVAFASEREAKQPSATAMTDIFPANICLADICFTIASVLPKPRSMRGSSNLVRQYGLRSASAWLLQLTGTALFTFTRNRSLIWTAGARRLRDRLGDLTYGAAGTASCIAQ